MAYSSRTSGGRSSSRLGGRSGYSAPRGGGGNNAAPAVIAGVAIVLLVVVAFLVLGKKKDKPQPAPVEPTPVVKAPTAAPVKPAPVLGPKPSLPADIVARAKALMPMIKAASEEGKRLGDEAHKAKAAGDQQAWQNKLEEARGAFKSARDEWIAIEDELATFLAANPSQGWDENMLMDAYLKVESREVQRLIDEPLSGMAKSGRGH